MDDLIGKLSEIRSQYNCFDEAEEPYYRALSEAIKKLSERVDGDTISRQTATQTALEFIVEYLGGAFDEDFQKELIERMNALPPAQPKTEEQTAKSTQNVPNDDLISRKMAIDKLNTEIIKRRLMDDVNDGMLDEFDTESILRKLPSARPEIIRCKDCKYADDKPISDGRHWCSIHGSFMYYCSDAERREE